jgi:Organic solute transport protein 1
MSGIDLALPFLILNMGGEMMYILNQRLLAQKIPPDKGDKVRSDVIKHLFSEAFIRELMAPQPLYSMTSTRQIFDKIAQSSIMKLQTSSMNKLFDLMLMGVKVQLLTLSYPEQLLKITLNHIEELNNMIFSKESKGLLSATAEVLSKTYASQSAAVFYRIRQTLLRFFQNRNVKVTMFLHSGIQLQDGNIRISSLEGMPLSDVPGKVIHSNAEVLKTLPITLKFKPSALSSRSPLQALTKLGLNMYDIDRTIVSNTEESKIESKNNINEKNREAVAKWELNSLANMICTQSDTDEPVPIHLFSEVDLEFKDNTVLEITGTMQNTHLDKIKNTLEDNLIESHKQDDDDLLDLL